MDNIQVNSGSSFSNLTVQLTPRQLQDTNEAYKRQMGCDDVKLHSALLEHIKKENKIVAGQLRNYIENVRKVIVDKEKEKDFFEFKIQKLDSTDDKIIHYEKEIFNIEKEIKENIESINKTEKEIIELEK